MTDRSLTCCSITEVIAVMFNSIDFATLVDLGFVFLVAASALTALMRDTTSAEKRALRLSHELAGLETALRELIGEAAAASSSLDRNLLRRKQELEQLIVRCESILAEKHSSEQVAETHTDPDFPNRSWIEERPKGVAVKRKSQTGTESYWLEELATETQDTADLNRRHDYNETRVAQREFVSAATANRRFTQQPLAREVEVVHHQEDRAERRFLEEFGDSVPHKIARRLLLSGKEIDVVAKKLNMPLAEIRAIDTIIRASGSTASSQKTLAGELLADHSANSADDHLDQGVRSRDAKIVRQVKGSAKQTHSDQMVLRQPVTKNRAVTRSTESLVDDSDEGLEQEQVRV